MALQPPERTALKLDASELYGSRYRLRSAYRWTLEEFDVSEEWFREALQIDRSMASPMHIAWTKSSWANMLIRRGRPEDREAAIALVDEALEMARIGQCARVERTHSTHTAPSRGEHQASRSSPTVESLGIRLAWPPQWHHRSDDVWKIKC